MDGLSEASEGWRIMISEWMKKKKKTADRIPDLEPQERREEEAKEGPARTLLPGKVS